MNWETTFYFSGTVFFWLLATVLLVWVGVLVVMVIKVKELKKQLNERMSRPKGISVWPIITIVVPLVWKLIQTRKSRG